MDNREEPIFEADLDGNFTWVNEAFVKIVKRSHKDLLGNKWRIIVTEEKRNDIYSHWESAIKEKRNFEEKIFFTDKKGNKLSAMEIILVRSQISKITKIALDKNFFSAIIFTMKLNQVLKNTAGRFTTLVVNRDSSQTTYCARINGVSDNAVDFTDVNTGSQRRVALSRVAFARSGSLRFGRERVVRRSL